MGVNVVSRSGGSGHAGRGRGPRKSGAGLGATPTSHPDPASPQQIGREFRALLEDGFRLAPAGSARHDPERSLRRYRPRYAVDLFDVRYYLTDVRQNPDIRFFVAYVHLGEGRVLYPRIFYKDVSLVWRSASHYVRSEKENWIGKGELRAVIEDGEEFLVSAEETTDLPLEIQSALETLMRRAAAIRTDHRAVDLVLRRGPDDRIGAYADFTRPREQARADPSKRVNGGRSIARFERPGDPSSLVFARGYEPDFERGIVEESSSHSRLYGGRLRRFRIASRNRRVQYLFIAGPHQVWIVPPQATSPWITSYGVRAVEVIADDDLCVPGYEYHFLDDSADPPEWVSQIPAGFAGPPSPLDPERCDASPWIDRLPVVKQFRRQVLGSRARA